MPSLEKAMQIKQKADGWIVTDEKGLHRFATEEEAKKYAGITPAPKKPKEEEKEVEVEVEEE